MDFNCVRNMITTHLKGWSSSIVSSSSFHFKFCHDHMILYANCVPIVCQGELSLGQLDARRNFNGNGNGARERSRSSQIGGELGEMKRAEEAAEMERQKKHEMKRKLEMKSERD
jgi:hypothetical protein